MAPTPPNTIYIGYFDPLDDARANALIATCTQLLAQHKPDALYFLMSSPGGSVRAGVTLYNYLKAIPAEVIMHNMGMIDSIATVVFLAGDKRYAAPHSSFLYHGVMMTYPNGARMALNMLEEQRSSLIQDQAKISGIIADNTKMSQAELEALFAQGESKDLVFAKTKGVIHDVRVAEIPKGALHITVNFQPK